MQQYFSSFLCTAFYFAFFDGYFGNSSSLFFTSDRF